MQLDAIKGYDWRMLESVTGLYPRYAEPRLVEALGDSPAVLIHGPRQCGKTTLSRALGSRMDYAYFTFDDAVARGAAQSDPAGFVADLPERVILDEVQRVPSLFSALKLAIDRNRAAGRFILTGSANVLLVPTLSDSLAGRREILRLHPMARVVMLSNRCVCLDEGLKWIALPRAHGPLGVEHGFLRQARKEAAVEFARPVVARPLDAEK